MHKYIFKIEKGHMTSNSQGEQQLLLLDVVSWSFRNRFRKSTCLDMSQYIEVLRYRHVSISRYIYIYKELSIYNINFIFIMLYICIYIYIYIYIFMYIFILKGLSADVADPNPERVTPPRPTPGESRGAPETNIVINQLCGYTLSGRLGCLERSWKGSRGIPWGAPGAPGILLGSLGSLGGPPGVPMGSPGSP